MVDFSEQRKYMIDGNLRPGGVRDPVVLKAVGQIHRENFLPENLKALAYIDDDIKLDKENFLMRPNDLLRMILALQIQPSHKVLDVGCTTGYSSIILSFLAGQVVGIDEKSDFLSHARELADLEGIMNTKFVSGSAISGCPNDAPYDAILLQRACLQPAQALVEQLAEGGRLAFIKQTNETFGQACLLEKHHGQLSQRVLFEMCVPYFTQDNSGFKL